MRNEEITIRVEPDSARIYRNLSGPDRRKVDLLLSLRLHEILSTSGNLQETMREISRKAQERGLTPEELESILHSP